VTLSSRLIVRVLLALLAFAVLARLPAGLDVGFQFDAALAVVWGFGILSLVLLTGYVGQVSLCQATFAGVGAYAAGISSDLLTATLLATRAPVVVCPAMHTEMWEHPAVQDNNSSQTCLISNL